MWIESIDLDDFGHFDRARLTGLDDGLAVIAGPQRAGKTTCMEAVRYLGYGLTSGTNVPPATDRYDVTATVVKDGYRYELALDGYADPSVTKLDGGAPDQTPRELFGNVRERQYQQLYTVSLDELSRDPDSLGDDVDLSNVLLEAASGGDITDVPDVRDELADRAKDIGGKHGRASYELKDPLNTIQRGIEERDDATDQVAEYEENEEEKRSVERRIGEIEEEIEANKAERTRLEAVLAGHETYQALQECTANLESKTVEDVDRFPVESLDDAKTLQADLEAMQNERQKAEREFDSTVESSDPGAYRERLVDASASIKQFDREKSGWKQRAKNLCETNESLDSERQRLTQRASNLGTDWDSDPLDAVRELETDLFSNDAIDGAVDRHQSAESDVRELSQEIDELEERRDGLRDRIESAVETADGVSVEEVRPVAATGSIAALVAGGVLAVAGNPIVGVATTTIVLLVTGGYALSQLDTETATHDGVAVDTLRAEAEKVRNELDAKRTRLTERQDDLAEADDQIDELRGTYGLPADASANAVSQFYDALDDLKGDLAEYEAAESRFEENTEEFRDDLDDVVGTLDDVGVLETPIGDPVDTTSEIFAAIDRAVDHVDGAADVQKAKQGVRDVEREVVTVLERWDETASASVGDSNLGDELDEFVTHGERVQEYRALRERRNELRERLRNQVGVQTYSEALEAVLERTPDEEDYWLIDAYEAVLNDYGDIDDVEGRRDELDSAIDELADEKETRRKEITRLERELEDLASDTDVRDAHETIERGRRRLEPLAEEYASHRIAQYLLDELHERFIERTTGPLLAEASDIFQRITGDAYTEVDTRDEFDGLDFEAVLEDGGVHRTRELSRATAEQLFLAVRLARIKRYEEPLPVLLDGSLTNFDPGHVQRTLDVVCELADETQVFLLTCHPNLVDRVADSYDAQYWCLDDGAFDGPHRTTDDVRRVFGDGRPGQQTQSQS